MTPSADPIPQGEHHHDRATLQLLGAIDRASLRQALENAIHDAEDDVADLIAEDYADDDEIYCVGEDVLGWELAALREIGGHLQAACTVSVGLYRDEDDYEDESSGTICGCCWLFIEFAEHLRHGAPITPSRWWVAIERAGPIPWTAG